MIQVIVIDDEDHIRDSLAKLLARHCPQVAVVGTGFSVDSGIQVIREIHPDLVLLDIQMNDGTGFDLLQNFSPIEFKVIFITAYDQYALQAFRFCAVDYLLKPVNPEQLVAAIDRAGLLISDHLNVQMNALYENLKSVARQDKKIILKTANQIHLLDLKSIICCESDSCYTTVHTSGNEHIMVAKTLKEYDEMLTGCGFYRVHKSHLINLAHIKRFDKQDGGTIVLTNDLRIPVASRKREEVLELIERMGESK
ncbi:MAG: response regulator transcription factor [Bacteroidetes bacterium]|nr:response regulator transcription factor [Bacteroidota bacterium]MBL6943211.1 response regulator transcription factor [Bacteroidales bacterium]